MIILYCKCCSGPRSGVLQVPESSLDLLVKLVVEQPSRKFGTRHSPTEQSVGSGHATSQHPECWTPGSA